MHARCNRYITAQKTKEIDTSLFFLLHGIKKYTSRFLEVYLFDRRSEIKVIQRTFSPRKPEIRQRKQKVFDGSLISYKQQQWLMKVSKQIS